MTKSANNPVSTPSDDDLRGMSPDKLSDGFSPLSHERMQTDSSQNDITHPANDLRVVMNDILRSGTDDSFCFLNEGQIRERLGLFRDYFIPELTERRILYAIKANQKRRIREILMSEGLDGFDCASINEVHGALRTPGILPENVYFNNPTRRSSSTMSAYAQGIRYYTAQSRSGVQSVLDCSRALPNQPTEIAVRVETQNNPGAAINLAEKYGSDPEGEVAELIRQIRKGGAAAGLSMHTGSQNTDPTSFSKGVDLLSDLARREDGVTSFNLGGGLPTKLKRGDYHDLKAYLKVISQSARNALPHLRREGGIEPKLILEPGRALVAEAVDLVIPILEIHKRRGERRIFMNDGIFMSFLDAAVHGWNYDFQVYTKDGRTLSDEMVDSILYGQTCDSGDKLGRVILPSDLQEGDFLRVANAGAYMDSQFSRFNDFDPPSYVFYNGTNS